MARPACSNLVAGIDARRTIALERLIFGLGIRDIGDQTSLLLARHFGDWASFHAAALDAASGIPSPEWTRLAEGHGVSPRTLSVMASADLSPADPWPEAPIDQKLALAFPGVATPARRALAPTGRRLGRHRRTGRASPARTARRRRWARSLASPASAPSPPAPSPSSSTSRTIAPSSTPCSPN